MCDAVQRHTSSGVYCPWYVGGLQTGSATLADAQETANTINPYPVWTRSSTWVGLEAYTGSATPSLAQLGFIHYNGNSNSIVFSESTDGLGSYHSPVYYNVASSSETYIVGPVTINGVTEWDFCRNENCQYGNVDDWSPTAITSEAEIRITTRRAKVVKRSE